MTTHEQAVRAWVIRLAAAFGYRIADETLSEYVEELQRVRSSDAVWESALSRLKRESERFPAIAGCFGALAAESRAAVTKPDRTTAEQFREWQRDALDVNSPECHEAMVEGAMRNPGWTRERAERFVKNLRMGGLIVASEKARRVTPELRLERPMQRALAAAPEIADYDDSIPELGEGL